MVNNRGEFFNSVFSSFEGHAMIILKGNNLMNLKISDLTCYFEPAPTNTNFDQLKSYRSPILKDKTSCPIDDYYCNYWTTSYQFTNQQIACYTPKIPELDRIKFSNGIDYYVSIVFGENLKITCSDLNRCKVKFADYYTPVLNYLNTSNFYAGSSILFRLKPNRNTLEQLIDIKIGRNNCIPTIPDNYTDSPNDFKIECQTGDFQSTTINDFTLNYMWGFSTIPFHFKKFTHTKNLSSEFPYYFKIFPKIDKINTNQSFSNGGSELEILGKGFNPDNIKVFIDSTECTNLRKISSTSVTCTTSPTTIDLTKTIFYGSKGLRLKKYDMSSSLNLETLNNYLITGTGKLLQDDIILETSTKPSGELNYGQYINGFFKAPYTGKYRFWSTSDDVNQIYLTFPDETGETKRTAIIDTKSSTAFDDFLTKLDTTRSAWINLVEDQYYPLEIYHLQSDGQDHFRLGLEISEYGILTNLDPFPNQANPIQNFSVQVKYTRDLYEIPIQTIDPNATVKIGCMDGPSVDIKSSDLPWQFSIKLRSIESSFNYNSVIRKYPVNENKKYFNTDKDKVLEFSTQSSLKFENMYLNSNVKDDLKVETSGVLKGYSFLFFIEKRKSERTYRHENNCYYINPGTTKKNYFILKQAVSEEASGTFAMVVKDLKNNKEYKTDYIDIKNEPKRIFTELNNIPILMNNFQFTWRSQLENFGFFLRYSNKLKLKFSFDTSNLRGGYNNTFDSTIEDIISPESKNLFFFPITSEFLYTKNTKPQVRVISNENEAVCLTEICSFNFIDQSIYPKVKSATLKDKTISMTLDKILPSEIKKPIIYLGENLCIPTSTNTINLTCTFEILKPGIFKPFLNTELGNLINEGSILEITGFANGGKIITINGNYFPIELDNNIKVFLSNVTCSILSITNTQITCLSGIKEGNDFSNNTVKITYKSLSTENKDFFTYKPSLPIPVLNSVSESYISPGEKKTLTFNFDNLSGITIDKISINLEHKFSVGYSIKINPLAINLNSLTARFGGAKPGDYNLLINFKDLGLSKINSSINFKIGFEINSINPAFGSIEGGTEITITGKNFLKTQTNQNIFIGKTRCLYKPNFQNDSNIIKCITQKPTVNTPIDQALPVVIEQMIQYTSNCSINSSGNCEFIYDTNKTSMISRIGDNSTNDNLIFGLNDNIIIYGSNFLFSQNFMTLTFNWGGIEIISKTNTMIKGKINSINEKNFGINEFLMYNEFGLSINNPETPYQTYNKVMIFLKKPDLVINSVFPLTYGQYGTIIKFYTNTKDFQVNGSNTITICNDNCEILSNNLLSDAQGQNHIQCLLKKSIIYSSCNQVTFYYYGIKTELKKFTFFPKNNNFFYTNIQNSANIDISNKGKFKIVNPNNFSLKIIFGNDKIDFQNLKILVDNRYEFKANTPGVLNSSSKAEYTVNFPNGLPAGSYLCSVFEDSVGFLLPPSNIGEKSPNGSLSTDFKLNIPLILNPITPSVINPSFNGGFVYTINAKNLNSLITDIDQEKDVISSNSFQKVLICGFPATILEAKSTYIKFSFPQILIKTEEDDFTKLPPFNDLMNNNYYANLLEYTNQEIYYYRMPFLNDDNSYTGAKTTLNGYVGIKIKEIYKLTSFKIYLGQVKIFIGDQAAAGDFDNGVIEGSQDGLEWSKIMNLPKSLPFMWYTINISYTEKKVGKLFRYIRLKPNVESYISEIRFYGHIVLDGNSNTYKCDVNIVDNFNNFNLKDLTVLYDNSQNISLIDINPPFTSSNGNTDVLFTFSDQAKFTSDDKIEIKIYSNLIPKEKITVKDSNTLIINMVPKDLNKYNRNVPLSIYIERVGNVYLGNLFFQYLDRWSSTDTWGGEFIPSNGETAYVNNADVLIDMDFNLNTLVVENGSIQVEDGVRDYNLSARNILVKNGEFKIGSENNSFKKNLTLTLNGDNKDPALPIFGNKVLAVMEGSLEIFGKERNPTYALLSSTVKKGDLSIKLNCPVDWNTGEEIVIASSSHIAEEAERRTIKSIDKSNPNIPIIILDTPLIYGHYGEIESYSANGITDTIDMRAEVILLTRNIIIQGDESSIKSQYGVHIMLASMKIGLKTTKGKLSNIEVRRAGQAYQLGRYPIHFHMIGDVPGSYVRNCSIHDTYNRGLTIHAVNEFLVENNVAYNVMGHTFFIEDAVETNNIIRNNVGILTKSSFSLLNTDYTPATFWITNPSNFFEKNRAAGSHFYGFWMDLPIGATGLNAGLSTVCPRGMPLGSFKDNVSHSNGRYGFRIFPEFNPKNKPCGIVDGINILTVPSIFENMTIYRNKEKGFITEKVGNVVFKGFKVAENPESSMEIADLIRFNGGMASISDSIIIGYTNNPVTQNDLIYKTLGLITPRNDNLLVDNVRFYNFNKSGFIAPFSSCSRCEHSPASTDSDGRTHFFKNIKYDSTITNKIKWSQPRKAIFRDLDGTLTGTIGGGWVTAYYPHLITKECRRDSLWDDGVICDNSVQVRRVSFYDMLPTSINGQDLKILQVPKLDTIDPMLINDLSKYSVLKFKERKDPLKAWTAAFISGYNYFLTWGSGLNFEAFSVERSSVWESSDKPMNLLFNYSNRRDEFKLNGVDNSSVSYNISQIQDLSSFESPSELTSSKDLLEYGSFKNNIDKNYMIMRINAINPKFGSNLKLNVTAIQCKNNDCGSAPISVVKRESFVRKWSDPLNWPNNKVPVEGDDVEIKSAWQMLLDISTENLKSLTINGLLFLDDSVDNLTINSKIILIKEGKFEIGTKEKPYTKKVSINLLGDKFSKNLVIDETLQLTNKILANLNDLSMNGEDRGPYTARLLQTVNIGEKIIIVEKSLKWLPGDEIAISTTSFFHNETEKFSILSYNAQTGELTLDNPVIYSHYGAKEISVLADNPTIPLKNPDERAEIYMLTRNIKIKGSQDWGCNIISISKKTSDFVYNGKMFLNNVEINYCGQPDREYSSLQFLNTNAIKTSYISNVSLNNNNYIGININKSSNLNFNNIILFNPIKFGVNVFDSYNINLSNVIVSKLDKRPFSKQFNQNVAVEANACFNLCQTGTICKDIKLSNTTCAGSEFIGYLMEGNDCSVDLKLETGYNTAFSCKIGLILTNIQNNLCIKGGNFVSMRNWMNGYFTNPIAENSYHENIISINDKTGISILSATNSTMTRKNVQRIIALGQSSVNPLCIPVNYCDPKNAFDKCVQKGMIISTTGISPFIIPMNKDDFPVENSKRDGNSGSFFDGDSFTFSNWEDQCLYSSYAINSNMFSSDTNSIHNLKNIILNKVLEDNFIFFENPQLGWIGDFCGKFPCSGPNNIIIKIMNFNETTQNQDNNKIIQNPKWPIGLLKQYIFPNKEINGNKISNRLKDGVTLIPLKYDLQDCHIINSWNGLICPKRDLGMFILENIEPAANTRSIAPVIIENIEENFVNTINSFMDHKCELGYPSHLRTPIHSGLITMNKYYNLTFTGTNPAMMKAQMVDIQYPSGPKKYAVFKIKFSSPQTIIVFDKTGNEIKSREWKENDILNINDETLKCGDSRWTSVENTLDFYLTNDENCILTFKTVNSIRMSLRLNMSVEDFYSKGSSNQLIYNIAAVLGIPPELIRITGILKGSAIVKTQILEEIPHLEEILPNNFSDPTKLAPISNDNDYSSVDSISNVVNGKIDLNSVLESLISSIQTGSLTLPASVMDIKFNVVNTDIMPTTDSNTGDVRNNTINNPDSETKPNQGYLNIITPTNVFPVGNATIIIQPGKNNTTTVVIENEGNKYNVLYVLLIFIPILVIMVVILIIAVRNSRRKQMLRNSEFNSIKDIELVSESSQNMQMSSDKRMMDI